MYSVDCITVPADMAQRIASGAERGVAMVPGMAEAVESPDLENVYVVAMQFTLAGVAETQLGRWAVSPSLEVDQPVRIMAADRSAQRVTRWPPVRYATADLRREVEATIGDSAACLLK